MSDICKCGHTRHDGRICGVGKSDGVGGMSGMYWKCVCEGQPQPAPTGVEESDVKCTSIQSTAIAATAPHSGNSAPAPPAPDAGAESVMDVLREKHAELLANSEPLDDLSRKVMNENLGKLYLDVPDAGAISESDLRDLLTAVGRLRHDCFQKRDEDFYRVGPTAIERLADVHDKLISLGIRIGAEWQS